MEKFMQRYRVNSARAGWWNYAQKGDYFITIKCNNSGKYFGRIEKFPGPIILLSDIGKIVDEEWKKTFDLRADMNLKMGPYVIMPNHFHAIISIGENQYNSDNDMLSAGKSLGNQSKNLASIINNFKGSVTRRATKINPEFQWMKGFHDHIIRNPKEYEGIEKYILSNPENWANDDNFHKN